MSIIPDYTPHAKIFVVWFSNVADEKFADRKHVTLQDLVSLPTFQNHILLANLTVTDESGGNQAEIV